ncbi:MAG: molybdopterin molybdotransferase MoeA [Desulfuromonadaceae bacterium]|nr:molybdopterin molybdotransferase MoeA [Desulfuromonadaceae bacterium]MDD2846919.1 molybdopterin molybdotransferase MoeA [Desulfuromonadaceae bacterium]MDD4129103.1 molybdopterin molybdotransferase MoeA [Desulfuromonadaceae bacterium]
MPSFEDARRIILDSVSPLGVERVELLESQGRVIAEDVVAPWNMPFCDNSAMDGYAVRACDCAALPAILRIIGYIPAGADITGPVEPGCAIRIMTGAPIPPGCDAVVPVEETDDGRESVTINAPVTLRQHIRFTGEDVPAGETIITAGTLIRPQEISMLASFAKVFVPVYRQARVAILSTGDELTELGEPLAHGKIVNSNALSLAAAVKEIGAIPVILGIARDNHESHREKMAEGLKADALITSAGVSAGDRDLVREVLTELGMTQVFWRVDIKPGGPTAFGLYENKPVFCLPGNPVSTMVTFEEFARPALLKMMGHKRVIKPLIKAVLQNSASKKPGKINFLRVKLVSSEGRYLAYSSGDQNTGILKTMLMADAMAVLPANRTTFSAGEEVDVHILSGNVGMLEE